MKERRRRPNSRPPEQPERAPGRSDRRKMRKTPPRREPDTRRERRQNTAHKRRQQSGTVVKLLAMLLIVVVFLVGLAIFFKVTDIQVTGSQLYTQEEIAEVSGIQMGDNLITLRKPPIAGRLQAMLPYIENVRIRRVLPSTVVIEVTESAAAYTVQAEDGTSWLISSSGKVLEQTPISAADYPKLLGLTIQTPKPGNILPREENESLAAAETVMKLLESTSYISSIRQIDVTELYDIVVWYGDQYEIHLGGSDQMEYKIQYLSSILDELDDQQGGIIDLTLEEKNVAIFKQWPDSTSQNTEFPENSEENS